MIYICCPGLTTTELENPTHIRHIGKHLLRNIPVLDDLVALKTENVHLSQPPFAGPISGTRI